VTKIKLTAQDTRITSIKHILFILVVEVTWATYFDLV